MACSVTTALPGISVDSASCQVTVDTTGYAAGTYQVTVVETSDTTGAEIGRRTVEFTVDSPGQPINIYQFVPTEGCPGSALECISDHNGTPYEAGTDADGNPCLIIPSPVRKAVPHTDGNPDVSCCAAASDVGNFAYNTDTSCVTHLCAGEAGWVDVCAAAVTGGTEQVCYNFTAATFPLCWGGGMGSWTTPAGFLLTNDNCAGSTTGSTMASPVNVETTCGFESSSCGAFPANPDALTWTATGSDILEATGDPADGWACTRPTLRTTLPFTAGLTASGNLTASFTTTAAEGGCLNLLLWDGAAGEYVPIVSTVGDGFVSGSDQQIYAMFFPDLNNAEHTVTFSGAGRSLDNLQVIVTATGNHPNSATPLETINPFVLSVPLGTGTEDCCVCVNDLLELAAAMNNRDSQGWAVSGSTICADVASAAGYGPLAFCNSESFNTDGSSTGGPVAPVFTVQPADQCVDTTTDVCATCEGGVTTFQEFVNGVWTNV